MDSHENDSSSTVPPAAKRRRIGDNAAANGHQDTPLLFAAIAADASESNHRPNDVTPDEDSMNVDGASTSSSKERKYNPGLAATPESHQGSYESADNDDPPTSRGLKRKAPNEDDGNVHIKNENSDHDAPPDAEDPTSLLASFAATASMAAGTPPSAGTPSSSSVKPKQAAPKEERVNWEPKRREFYSQLRAKLDATDGCCWLTEFHFLIPITTLRALCGLEDLSKLTSRLCVSSLMRSVASYLWFLGVSNLNFHMSHFTAFWILSS
jgi:hypothetical protein